MKQINFVYLYHLNCALNGSPESKAAQASRTPRGTTDNERQGGKLKTESERQWEEMPRPRGTKPKSIARLNRDEARGPDDNTGTTTVHVSSCMETNLEKYKQN